MTSFPAPYAAARVAAFLDDHLSWSAWWDKNSGLWRVAEDDIDSDLYAESRDADVVIRYMRRTPERTRVNPWAESSCGQGSRRSKRGPAQARRRLGLARRRDARLTGVSAVGVFVIAGILRGGSPAVHSAILAAIGAVLFAGGIALAVWAACTSAATGGCR